MRAIFVNHCHPDCPHVCGTRAREFANALARQGHQIVLLTESLNRGDPAIDPATLPAALAAHDWLLPFRLAVPPRPAHLLRAVRSGRVPAPLRTLVIAYQYLLRGGMFTDWRQASRRYWRPLAEGFRPDVVWGIFGNTDAWAIAQGIARAAACPWVRDIKDRWGGFVPAPLRRTVARRFADARSTTALSYSLLDDALPWLQGEQNVIYSGVPDGLVRGSRPANQQFTVVLIGGVYRPALLELFMSGVAGYLSRGRLLRLVYAGTDGAAVGDAARRFGVPVEQRGQLPWNDYWDLVTQADVNAYIRIDGLEWHHKFVELLVAQRPILCCPSEIGEARRLASSVGGHLHEVSDPAAIAAALETLADRPHTVDVDASAITTMTWGSRAMQLAGALGRAARQDN